MQLGVNIDHVATLRQARYAANSEGMAPEPDIIAAASACERAGAHGITVHLRADRRHIQDLDVVRLRKSIITKLNLELGNTPEIISGALRVLPEEACLVPESRREVTTEGGLDALGQRRALEPTVQRLQAAGIRVSLFVEPDPAQLLAARDLGVEMVELHTGAFANAVGPARDKEFARLTAAAVQAQELGIQLNAGHGINYENIREIRTLPGLAELNIGHSIVSRAVFVGLEAAVAEMLQRIGSEA